MNYREEQMNKTIEIETILSQYLPKELELQSLIAESMEYALMAGGKRIRPMLMNEVYRMFGGTGKEIECFMVAQEMIHTYSLVHDDLPAMDDDDYRRGRKTTHVVYGEDMGVLTGDALLNYAFEVAASAFDLSPEHSLRIGKAIQVLGRKAGVYGMIGGQVVDVKSSHEMIDSKTLDFIFRLKTGALIESAMIIGGILGGANEAEIATLEKIALNIGMAFQIQDDILDLTSTTEVLGKPVLSDEKNEKTTYVTIHGMDQAKKDVASYSKEAIELLQGLKKDSTYLEWLVNSLINRVK